jgi:hypothetical protein
MIAAYVEQLGGGIVSCALAFALKSAEKSEHYPPAAAIPSQPDVVGRRPCVSWRTEKLRQFRGKLPLCDLVPRR